MQLWPTVPVWRTCGGLSSFSVSPLSPTLHSSLLITKRVTQMVPPLSRHPFAALTLITAPLHSWNLTHCITVCDETGDKLNMLVHFVQSCWCQQAHTNTFVYGLSANVIYGRSGFPFPSFLVKCVSIWIATKLFASRCDWSEDFPLLFKMFNVPNPSWWCTKAKLQKLCHYPDTYGLTVSFTPTILFRFTKITF